VRLATFNLLHGRSLSDGTVHAGRVAAAVTDLDADVLGLQEVDRAQPRSGLLDLTAIAAEALHAPTHRFAAAVVGTPGHTWQPWRSDDDNIHPLYGIALVSRYPVRRWQLTRLPAAPIRSPVLLSDGGVALLRDEPRVLLAAVLDTPRGPITVATTHLSFVPGWNVRQLRAAVRAMRALPGPRMQRRECGAQRLRFARARWLKAARNGSEVLDQADQLTLRVHCGFGISVGNAKSAYRLLQPNMDEALVRSKLGGRVDGRRGRSTGTMTAKKLRYGRHRRGIRTGKCGLAAINTGLWTNLGGNERS